jgi:eukaryotic-like serine/threonine-protein kinase
MTLTSGSKISHYEITAKIGEGGMGVVYKAKDSHLDRFVAIKVLPPERVSDPTRKARFVQEAKAASALNHPNIITVHDIDQQDGVDFIVMEYVSGKTLDEMIPRKGMKLSDALKYAVQIADALSKAHSAGIIHRDVKPYNVLVGEDGRVKILDFGLAKLTEAAPLSEDEATRTIPTTDEGMIVGTVAYMSPEQAEGKRVDARSDIFSFGSVLYEMVTGKRAFQKESKSSTLGAIIHKEPEPLGAEIPHDLESIITRCLRKDPDRRFQHMDDVKIALQDLKEESESGKLASVPVTEHKRSRRWIWAVAAAVVLSAALVWRLREASPPSDLKPVALTSYSGVEQQPSFSPDGNKVAFSWNGEKEDNYDIYIKQIGSAGAPPMRLTKNPADESNPAWSPDDQWIAFLRYQQQQNNYAIMLISPLGVAERKLTEGLGYPDSISWTPDGKWLAYTAQGSPNESGSIWAISIETGERRRLTTAAATFGDSTPSFSPDGRTLAFQRQVKISFSGLYAQRLTKDLRPDGEPAKITDAQYDSVEGIAWTSNGREIVYAAGGYATGYLWKASVSGQRTPTRLQFAQSMVSSLAIARTLPRLAYTWIVVNTNLWRLDTRTNERKMLIGSTYASGWPQYSPDGSKIVFSSNRSGSIEIWTCNADGTNCLQLTSLGRACHNAHWSPDGRWLAFTANAEGQYEIYVMAADGGAAHKITNSPSNDENPTWSRNGGWIYFSSNRSGRYEIWKVPKDGGEEIQITHSGGLRASESWDGQYIYYYKDQDTGPSIPLFRMRTEGGPETEVALANGFPADSDVTEKGVYFFAPGAKEIQLLDPGTGKVSTLATLDKESGGQFTASPDDAYIVWTQDDRNTTDLMLVEGFR